MLISHKHGDHTDGIDKIVDASGAVVRAVGSGFLRGLGGPLTDGEVIDAAGLRIKVMATPGHTADSLSFLVDDAVLTADTVLGRGTTVIDDEDGSLGDYLDSLRRLQGLGHRTVLPGHGPDLDDLQAVTRDVPGAPRGTARSGAAGAAGARRRRHRASDRRTRLHRRRRKAVGRRRWSPCRPSSTTSAIA